MRQVDPVQVPERFKDDDTAQAFVNANIAQTLASPLLPIQEEEAEAAASPRLEDRLADMLADEARELPRVPTSAELRRAAEVNGRVPGESPLGDMVDAAVTNGLNGTAR